jgi:phosphomannomutase
LINNDSSPDFLNEGCGAEFVQKDQKLPKNWAHPDKKCMAFDGDADRQIYFYGDSSNNIKIIDGDK